MKFIEMSGKTLRDVVRDDEISSDNLESIGIGDHSIVRINQQGDLEVRKTEGWDIIGGLIGDFASRVRKATGLDWA